MAASVDNRPYSHLKPAMNGVVARTFKPGRTYPLVSPIRARNFPPTKPAHFADSSSEDEDSDSEEGTTYKELIKKGNAEVKSSVRDPRDEGTADRWIERNHTMVRLTGKHPFNAEPPLARLMHHGFITPVPLHYVRNHGPVPRAPWRDWTVEVTGLVKRPSRFTMDQLVNEFASREFPVTLVSAGNRRKEQNMVKQTIGFDWGPAAVSTSVWRGVPLRDVLRRCGIMGRRGGALNVCFEGAEDLPGGGGSKYRTSLRKEVAMDRSRDIILAYMQNGEVLSPDHGFPVRMVIPGFIGGRMVKWLKRIVVTTHESESYYHYKDNRVLPPHVYAELANAEAWWYQPEYIINELNINSVITTPGHEELLPVNSWTYRRPYTLRGYAYSGGGKKVTRVEVSMDGGGTWKVCALDLPEKPSRFGKYWCWCFWSLEVEVLDLVVAKEIAVRAWDESLNTQPEKLIWNVMGMMNNCWFRVKTNVCRPHKGEIGIIFDFPTQPGNQSGGWMAREKHLERSAEGNETLKKSVSSPFTNTAANMISESEVKKHDSADSAWIIVHGHVYDCTRFLKDHPGGTDSILINAGTDCTEKFDAIHSDKARNLLQDYRIGELITTGTDCAEEFDPILINVADEEDEDAGERKQVVNEAIRIEVEEEQGKGKGVRLGETAALSTSCSLLTSNDEDSSSTTTTTPVTILPSERCRRIIGNWDKGQLLGRGSFGSVYEGITEDGFLFAIKEVSLLDQGAMGRQSILYLEQEIALLSQFEHENIVQYYGTAKDDSNLYIFLELMMKGSLANLYQTYNLKESQVSAYTGQILSGQKYLHDRNVVHRDIKCANILVDPSGVVKLADFGLARATKLNDVKSCKGTAFWMAPEVVKAKNHGYGLPADIWSLGCTVLEMLTGQVPYSPLEWMSALFRIGRGELPPLPDSLSRDASDFILQCLQVNPGDRPTAAQLLDHAFVKRPVPTLSGLAYP